MKIDNIKNYIFDNNQEIFMNIADEIYSLTINLNDIYPDYKQWFYNKHIKGCLTSNRNILFIKNEDGKIIAFSCLKKTNEERKICTLFVSEEYRKQGIGSLLLEKSMEFLETTKPLVTFQENKLPMFLKLIKKYNWQLTEIIEGINNKNTKEICFNGPTTYQNYKNQRIKNTKI